MPTIEVRVRRFSVVSSRSFDEIVRRLTTTIRHPSLPAMTPAKFLRKERGGQGHRILRLVVGNPLIMKEIARTVPDAASYATATILIDERAGGVHLSYDLMASLSAPYGSQSALAVARELDVKIEGLLETAAVTTRCIAHLQVFFARPRHPRCATPSPRS